MKVLRETEVSLAFDGGNNVGMLALFHAAQATIEKAAAHGIALVSVTDAWMSGRSAYYVEMIAKAGLVAIHTAASSRAGGPARRHPADARHQSDRDLRSVVARADRARHGHLAYMMTEVMLRERLGELLPEGVAHRARRRADQGSGAGPARRLAAVRRLQGLRAGADDAGAGAARRLRLRCRERLRLSVHRLPARPARASRRIRARR